MTSAVPPLRSPADIVIPFAGTEQQLLRTLERVAPLCTHPADVVILADNRPSATTRNIVVAGVAVQVVAAAERASSYHARNRGAAVGSNEWLVFLDADVRPSPGLLDAYLSGPAAKQHDLLVGRITDVEGADTPSTLVGRYSIARQSLGSTGGSDKGPFAYAQTANVAVRREIFEQVDGFREDLWSGGDADFTFRVVESGGTLVRVETAQVDHFSRANVVGILRQYARYGAGGAWLDAMYPGFAPKASWLGRARYISARGLSSIWAALTRDWQRSGFELLDAATFAAFELGRTRSNLIERR